MARSNAPQVGDWVHFYDSRYPGKLSGKIVEIHCYNVPGLYKISWRHVKKTLFSFLEEHRFKVFIPTDEEIAQWILREITV